MNELEMYKDIKDITREYAVLSSRTASALEGLQDAIKDLNDSNILHNKALEGLSNEINVMSSKWWNLIVIMSGALVVLAGANKVLEFISL